MPLPRLIETVLASDQDSNPHGCLGLARGAAPSSIRKRYLSLALRLHPDKAQHPRAREAFAAMDGAFRKLWRPRRA